MHQKHRLQIASIAAIAVVTLGQTARAQTADVSSAVDSIEFRSGDLPRRVAPRIEPDSGGESIIVTGSADQTRFEFKFNAATTFATNPARREGGSNDAARILPTASISFADATGNLAYGFELNATTEGFAGGEGADTSILGAKANASLWNRSERLMPYFVYSPKLVYSGILVKRDVTFHDLTIGVGRTLPLGGGTIALDASFNRRLAPTGFRQSQPTIAALLKLPVSDGLDLSFRQQVQRRIFTGPGGGGRRDWNASSLLELSYELATGVVLRGALFFESNDSNIVAKSFSNIDVGPKLGFGLKF